jgi:hypothetical protein
MGMPLIPAAPAATIASRRIPSSKSVFNPCSIRGWIWNRIFLSLIFFARAYLSASDPAFTQRTCLRYSETD